MAKKVVKIIKLQAIGGKATPAPPLGPVLGQEGINIGEFVNQFNDKTKDMQGELVRANVSVHDDRSFSIEIKGSPASAMIKKMAGIEKGSGLNKTSKVGSLSRAQLRQIAEAKMSDLNATTVEAAEKIVAGTARSMGVDIK